MEKNEHSIFLDIPMGKKNGRFHSAVLTTYAIDLIHFDRHLLNTLHRKQICSVNILADYGQMAKSMEYVSPSFMERVGKEYSISNMLCPGAFHPKINFFVGDDSALVLLGTGNLTVAGHISPASAAFLNAIGFFMRFQIIARSWMKDMR